MSYELKESKPMASEGKSIDYLRIEPATNGFIISYTEKTKTSGKGTYDNCSYKEMKEVFDIDDDSEDDINKAFDRFKELAMKQYSEMKAMKK